MFALDTLVQLKLCQTDRTPHHWPTSIYSFGAFLPLAYCCHPALCFTTTKHNVFPSSSWSPLTLTFSTILTHHCTTTTYPPQLLQFLPQLQLYFPFPIHQPHLQPHIHHYWHDPHHQTSQLVCQSLHCCHSLQSHHCQHHTNTGTAIQEDHISFLWYKHVLTNYNNKLLVCAAYAVYPNLRHGHNHPSARSVLVSSLSTGPTAPSWIQATGHSLHHALHFQIHIPQWLPIHHTFCQVLLGYYKPDLTTHDTNTTFINAFPGHFCSALSLGLPPPTLFNVTSLSTLSATFTAYESTTPSHLMPLATSTCPPTFSHTLTSTHIKEVLHSFPAHVLNTVTTYTSHLCNNLLPHLPAASASPNAPNSNDDILFSNHWPHPSSLVQF